MEAADLGRLVGAAMDGVHQRDGRRKRWYVESDEIVWVFELDRGAAWSPWGLIVGCAVREWSGGDSPPPASSCHVVVHYALLGEGVPDVASSSRFDDHASFFTMISDHTHELTTLETRRAGYEFMAADLGELAGRISTRSAVSEAVAAGEFRRGLVDRRLRS